MDEKLLKKLIRQVKILNFFIASFGVLTLISIAIIGFLLWQVVSFAQDVNKKAQETKQQLNVQNQACKSDALGNFLKQNSEVCR